MKATQCPTQMTSTGSRLEVVMEVVMEVVPNNAYDYKWHKSDLKPVQPMQPRIGTRIYPDGWEPSRKYINAPDRFNVMYSTHPLGRGTISHVEEVCVTANWDVVAEARAMAYEGKVRPRLISFPLPSEPEKYLWIDLSWPIRSILLPVCQMGYPGEKPNFTYLEINFTRLKGLLPTGSSAEEGSQSFSEWGGDNKKGLVWTNSAGTFTN